MQIVFSANKDNKTANLFVDNFLINEDIPYLPHLATDHRGAALYYYAKENNLQWKDFELDEATASPKEVERGFIYLFKPKHVLEAIKERIKPQTHVRRYQQA